MAQADSLRKCLCSCRHLESLHLPVLPREITVARTLVSAASRLDSDLLRSPGISESMWNLHEPLWGSFASCAPISSALPVRGYSAPRGRLKNRPAGCNPAPQAQPNSLASGGLRLVSTLFRACEAKSKPVVGMSAGAKCGRALAGHACIHAAGVVLEPRERASWCGELGERTNAAAFRETIAVGRAEII